MIDVVPAYVLVVLNVNLPAPSLFKLLLDASVPLMVLVMAISPTPPNVTPAVLVMPPLIVIVLEPEAISVLILVAVVAVIKPDKVAEGFPFNILKAPKLLTPKPFKLKASVTAVGPFNSKVAPLLTVVAKAPVPNASLLVI